MFRRTEKKAAPSPERDAWSFYESLGEDDRAGLSQAEREVAAICDLRQEVNAGGFDSYLRAWGGDSAPVALTALPTVLGQAWADLLGQATALLGPDYPADADDRVTGSTRSAWVTISTPSTNASTTSRDRRTPTLG